MTRDELKTEVLRLRDEDRMSAARIADKLGMTRSAIIGIWHRADCKSGKPVTPRPKKLPTITPYAARYVAPRVEPQEPEPAPVVLIEPATPEILRITDLGRTHCKWPTIRDEDGWRFCGDPRHDSSPYCNEHRLRAKGGSDASL